MTDLAHLQEENGKLKLEVERLRYLVDTVTAERDDLKQRAHRSLIVAHVDFERPVANQPQGTLFEYATVPDDMPDIIDPRETVAAFLFGAQASDSLFHGFNFRLIQLFYLFSSLLGAVCVVLSVSGTYPYLGWFSIGGIPAFIFGFLFSNIRLLKQLFRSFNFLALFALISFTAAVWLV